jgi:hypothetical protein
MRENWRAVAASIVVLSAALLLPDEVRPAEPDLPISVGRKIRLEAPTVFQGAVQGTVIATDDSSLLINTEQQMPLRVSRQAVTRLEVVVGRRRNARKGLIIGAAAGAALVGLVAATPKDSLCPPKELDVQECLDARSLFLTAGVPILALEGAGIGALIKSDRWSSVPIDKAHVTVTPTRHGLGLALSLRF